MRSLKVVLVGDTKVGKSCILSRFVQGTFDRNMPATIGAAFLTKVITTANGPVRLQLWDTADRRNSGRSLRCTTGRRPLPSSFTT